MSSYFLLLFWLCFVIFSFEMLEYFFFKLFISGCPGSSLLQVDWLYCSELGQLPSCGARAPHCCGFFCCGAWALGHSGSRTCGTGTWLLLHQWNLPRSGTEPVSPTVADRLVTTGPPGKSYFYLKLW